MYRLVVSCVSFMLLCGRIESAKDAVVKPFVIFQPGDFFDPFTENGLAESQRRDSIVPAQPGSFAEPPNSGLNAKRSRVRSIGQISGNAQQINAQLFHPSSFLEEFDKFSNQVTQNQATINSRRIDVPPQTPLRRQNPVRSRTRNPVRTQANVVQQQTPLNHAFQIRNNNQNVGASNPIRTRTRDPARSQTQRYQNPLLTQIPQAANPQRFSLPKVNDAKTAGSDGVQDIIKQALAADISALPVTLQKFYIEPQPLKSQIVHNRGLERENRGREPSRVHVIERPVKVVDTPVEASHVHPHHSSGQSGKSTDNGHHHDTRHHRTHDHEDEKDYEGKHEHSQSNYKKNAGFHDVVQKSTENGKQQEHHDEAALYKKHHEAEKSHKAGKFGEKKGHKRGHKTKGYHNKFHRDEFHREHRFYDDFHKEGFHEKHGAKQGRYKHKEGAYKKGKSAKSGKEGHKHKKKGVSKKGHVEQEHKGFAKGGGKKKYHKHHKDYHKKKGSSGGKQYGYQNEE